MLKHLLKKHCREGWKKKNLTYRFYGHKFVTVVDNWGLVLVRILGGTRNYSLNCIYKEQEI